MKSIDMSNYQAIIKALIQPYNRQGAVFFTVSELETVLSIELTPDNIRGFENHVLKGVFAYSLKTRNKILIGIEFYTNIRPETENEIFTKYFAVVVCEFGVHDYTFLELSKTTEEETIIYAIRATKLNNPEAKAGYFIKVIQNIKNRIKIKESTGGEIPF